MRFLVDTGPVIDYMHDVQASVDGLRSRIPDGLAISAVSVAELYEGVFRSRDIDEAERGLLDVLNDFTILVADEHVGRVFGRERARLRRSGTPMSDLDLMIASTALYYDLTLLTIDSDFERLEHLQSIFFESP